MRKILTFTTLLFFWVGILHAAKVLIIVESNYYNNSPNGKDLIDAYVDLVRAKDGYTVELINNFIPTGTMINQCHQLWNLLADEYQDVEIEGAVLVGDLPVPIFIQHHDHVIVPIDYVYMDVCDVNDNNKKYSLLYDPPGPNGEGVWESIEYTWKSGETVTYFDWIYGNNGTYDGDGKADIWVSRIYPVGLDALREDGALWGDFLEEYEILDSYLNRVIKRMDTQAEVPPRSMAIGYAYHHHVDPSNAPHNFTQLHELYLEGFKEPEQIHYKLYPNNTPEVYQTQLQNGPYGGDSWGAAGGVKYPDDCKITSVFPEYVNDTRGYEAACLFIHSSSNGHGWMDEHGITNDLESHGFTNSILSCIPWTKHESPPGHDQNNCEPDWFKTEDSYFKIPKDLMSGEMGQGLMGGTIGQTDSRYYFSINVNDDHNFDLEVYIPPNNQKFSEVYIRIWISGNAYFDVNGKHVDYFGWSLDIPDNSQGWVDIWDNHNRIYNLGGDHILTMSVGPTSWSTPPNDNIIVADAARLIRKNALGNPEEYWYLDNPEDMHKMEEHHYRTRRAITSMRDDGGPSKVLFTFMNCCQPNNFITRHCIGNMYALAHNGLISVGRPTTCSWLEYGPIFENLKNGVSFGKAYLDFVNSTDEGFPSKGWKTLALLGAGTIKAKAYIPYVDGSMAIVNQDQHTKWSTWIADHVSIDDMELYYESGQNYDPELNVYAGRKIAITSNGKGVTFCRGSKVRLKVDPELLNAQ